MLRTRVIPCLLIKNQALVKTIKFKNSNYIGDPINTVRIFNEMEVDEIVFLDITASSEKKKPPFDLIEQIDNECFMPFAYGGGIRDFEDVKRIFSLGVEKIIVNTYALENPYFIKKVADYYGSQSVIVCIDIKKNIFGQYRVYNKNKKEARQLDPVEYAKKAETIGAGEIMVYSVDKDGVMEGYDIELVRRIVDSVNIPVIACGGAGTLDHMAELVNKTRVSAVAAGSFFIYQGVNRAVLINFPDNAEIENKLK